MAHLKPSHLRDLATARWGPQRDWRCVYCGRSAPDGAVDHFIPRERGGTDMPWNLVPACHVCNRSKSDHEPLAWMRAVLLPPSTITALQTITRSPEWTAAAAGYRHPRFIQLDYQAADPVLRDPNGHGAGVPRYRSSTLLPLDLTEVFRLDPSAWAPATALRHVAADYLANLDQPPLSTQQLNKLLEERGFTRSTRKGVRGFRGFLVSPDTAAAGRFAAGPTATAASRRTARKRRVGAARAAHIENYLND